MNNELVDYILGVLPECCVVGHEKYIRTQTCPHIVSFLQRSLHKLLALPVTLLPAP